MNSPSVNVKEAYQKTTELRLKKLRSKITAMEKRVGKAEADIEVRDDQKMDQIRGQYAQAKGKLEEVGQTSQDAWTDYKIELDRAIDALSEAIDDISRHISD